ncbi:hypothetical protein F8M41_000007 [Gigaspora margarita]|uniref:Galactose oxidase n=1 Tax=Gigaspora margarita TaxID=4874 RepID=A0A8H4B5M3_GIGMA|nr:hypothetical protein F8M41_000007 [Gigaspora margarita]
MKFISRKSFLIFMGLIIMSVSEDIGPLASHCVVTYNDSFYIFGGVIGCETFALTNFFHQATPPFTQAKISWKPLSTINVMSVTDPGCIVDETRGLLFVLGGANRKINSTNPGIQVYNFNTQIWNEPQFSQNNFIPPDLITVGWGPRAVWLQPGIMFIWGAGSTAQFSYLLDITFTPWQWTVVSNNKSDIDPTKNAGVVAIKGNVFVFGGFMNDKSITNTLYIYSPKYGFITPQFKSPVPFNDGVVGVWNDKLSIIMLDAGTSIMEVVNFDLKTFEFGKVSPPQFITKNITTTRNRGHGAQFSWSDSVFIYGGTGNYCSDPILNTWVVYNMSSQTWETTFNDIKYTSIISDNLTLPKVSGLDINNEVTGVQQSASAVPHSTSAAASVATFANNNILIIILSSVIGVLLIVFTMIFIYMKRIINQYKEYDSYPMVGNSEISAASVVNI